jgi:cytochrome c oxidase cbb3-type subunit 3
VAVFPLEITAGQGYLPIVRRIVPFVLLVLVAGCRRAPTREWRADDHDEEPGSGAQVPGVAPSAAASAGDDALADTMWRSTCAVCHGMLGRGDGPNGPMVKAPDLTEKSFLASRNDAQLAAVIRGGKGKMPAFPQLPPSVVNALVRRVRDVGAMSPQ